MGDFQVLLVFQLMTKSMKHAISFSIIVNNLKALLRGIHPQIRQQTTLLLMLVCISMHFLQIDECFFCCNQFKHNNLLVSQSCSFINKIHKHSNIMDTIIRHDIHLSNFQTRHSMEMLSSLGGPLRQLRRKGCIVDYIRNWFHLKVFLGKDDQP